MLVDLQLPPTRQGHCTLHDARHHPLCDPRVHRHRELECNLILRGRCRYVVGNRNLLLGAQQLAWYFPGQDHMIMEQSPDFAMWVMVFSPEMVADVATELGERGLTEDDPGGSFDRRIAAGDAKRLQATCERIAEPRLSDAHCNHGLHWLLLECWTAFAAGEEVDQGDRIDPAVEAAMHLLQDVYGPERLPELAAACGVSPSWLSRRFHAQLGCTISTYRMRQRLQRCIQLAQGARTITEAAYAAGFGSYGQFYAACKQLTGKNPREVLSKTTTDSGP